MAQPSVPRCTLGKRSKSSWRLDRQLETSYGRAVAGMVALWVLGRAASQSDSFATRVSSQAGP